MTYHKHTIHSRTVHLKKHTTTHAHPLDPLTSAEILATSRAVRQYSDALEVPLDRLLFNSITLREPPKLSVLKWAGVVKDEEVLNAPSEIVRQAEVGITSLLYDTKGVLTHSYAAGPLPRRSNSPSLRMPSRPPDKPPQPRELDLGF